MNVDNHCSVMAVSHHPSMKQGQGVGKHNQEQESEFQKIIGLHGHVGHRVLVPACGGEYSHCGVVYFVPLRHPCSVVEVCHQNESEQENAMTMKEGESFNLEEGVNVKLDQGKLIAEFIDSITEDKKDEIKDKLSVFEMFLELLNNKEKSIVLTKLKDLC